MHELIDWKQLRRRKWSSRFEWFPNDLQWRQTDHSCNIRFPIARKLTLRNFVLIAYTGFSFAETVQRMHPAFLREINISAILLAHHYVSTLFDLNAAPWTKHSREAAPAALPSSYSVAHKSHAALGWISCLTHFVALSFQHNSAKSDTCAVRLGGKWLHRSQGDVSDQE